MRNQTALLLSLTMVFSSVAFANDKVSSTNLINTRLEQVTLSPYLKAATEGSMSALKKSLKKNINLNEKDPTGNTALMLAIANDHAGFAKLLIEKKADINLKNNNGQTALYIALVNDQADVALSLINNGASLEKISSEDDSALLVATTTNTHQVMNLILNMKPSLVNQANKNGITPLMEAARFGSADTISILLKGGADKSAKNSEGKTALEIATKAQNTDGIKLLQK
jgi:ankyrin repeat protein